MLSQLPCSRGDSLRALPVVGGFYREVELAPRVLGYVRPSKQPETRQCRVHFRPQGRLRTPRPYAYDVWSVLHRQDQAELCEPVASEAAERWTPSQSWSFSPAHHSVCGALGCRAAQRSSDIGRITGGRVSAVGSRTRTGGSQSLRRAPRSISSRRVTPASVTCALPGRRRQARQRPRALRARLLATVVLDCSPPRPAHRRRRTVQPVQSLDVRRGYDDTDG